MAPGMVGSKGENVYPKCLTSLASLVSFHNVCRLICALLVIQIVPTNLLHVTSHDVTLLNETSLLVSLLARVRWLNLVVGTELANEERGATAIQRPLVQILVESNNDARTSG